MTWREGVRVLAELCGRRCRAGVTATVVAATFAIASLVTGCSTSDGVGAFIVDPGHYSVYHCDGLRTRLQGLIAREQELSNLMDRASDGGGGVLIGGLSYRIDYENVLGEEKVLRRTAAEKKCDLPPPAVPMATPTAYTAPPRPNTPPPPAPGAPVFQSDQTIR